MITINKTSLDRQRKQRKIKEFLDSLEKTVKKIYPNAKLKIPDIGKYMGIPSELTGNEFHVSTGSGKQTGNVCRLCFLDYIIEKRIRLIKKQSLVGISGSKSNEGIFNEWEIGIFNMSVEKEVMNTLNKFENDFTIIPYSLYRLP